MTNCKTCKHWHKEYAESVHGLCRAIDEFSFKKGAWLTESFSIADQTDIDMGLITVKYFGCILHEEITS